MSKRNIAAAAKRLREAAAQKVTCDPIRNLIGATDHQNAYAVQEINNALRTASGARRVGSKIGLTSVVVQQQFGISEPDYGILFDDMEVLNGTEISVQQLMQPRAEAEIAFVLGKTLDRPSLGVADLLSAVEYVVASIEIVGSRIEGWDIRITDTIADNASASHFVLGHRPVRLENIDLINCQMTMEQNGEVVSQGKGGDCLGSPINALLWLARTMRSLGKPMQAGDIVLSGALGPMVNIAAGDHFKVLIEGMGEVSVNFVA
ncbi:MAG: fumarylacetoacetate hydrolase family protein [Bacteroidota bacterium]